MRATTLLLAALLLSGAVSAQDLPRAAAIDAEMARIAGERSLWPGFEPMSIPLAVFAGQNTYLFRHPAPPEGFAPVPDAQGVHVFSGRHPAIVANTSTEIGGALTATLLLEGPSAAMTPADLAAVALHEAFHVFQRSRYPKWAGNEGDMLLYPVDDARLLGLRRRESEEIRRALGASDTKGAACWAFQAMGHRRERFAAMDAKFSAYERLTELNEGLAAYVQQLASGKTSIDFPDGEFPAAQIRQRAYVVGAAMALLLDRLQPGWQASLESGSVSSLDVALEIAAQAVEPDAVLFVTPYLGTESCSLSPAEVAALDSTARQDAAAVAAGRTERRKEFEDRSGWRVVVVAAEGRPLNLQGFDPLNVLRVDGGLVHTRMLKLGNDEGELEGIDGDGADIEAFTEGAGEHPLFEGVKRVVFSGLPRPDVRKELSEVTFRAPGLEGHFKDATYVVEGFELIVKVAAPTVVP